VCLTILWYCAFALGGWQGAPRNNVPDIYQQVPKEQRELLSQSIQELVVAQEKRDWQAVWQLYDKRQGQVDLPYDQRKDELESSYLSKMQRMRRLRGFTPKIVYFFPPDNYWVIEGCASYEENNGGEGLWSDLHARWIGTRWYFSPVSIELSKEPGADGKVTSPRSCSLQ
jgi:hypothetical protein